MKNSNLSLERDDLRIAAHLRLEQMPSLLGDILQVANTDEEKDILLLSSLTALSSVMPNVQFHYGPQAKVYYPNLQTFIMAGAASGKGIANQALRLVEPVDAMMPLLIPGDSTYPSFFAQLDAQNGVGYMHESEGSVITDVWRSSALTYNTALRKAAEHEMITKSRARSGVSVIEQPKLSMLLTGTFSQFRALVPSVENGYFSRLTMLVVRGRQSFNPQVFVPVETANEAIGQASKRVAVIYESLFMRDAALEFSLTSDQADFLGDYFAKEYAALIDQLGDNFHPSVVRMGVTCMRLATILSVLRNEDALNGLGSLSASDNDFLTAVLLSGKLLLHAADAYNQIDGALHPAIPDAKEGCQKYTFFAALPEAFSTEEATHYGSRTGIAERTISRYLLEWTTNGSLRKIRHGFYEKMS